MKKLINELYNIYLMLREIASALRAVAHVLANMPDFHINKQKIQQLREDAWDIPKRVEVE